MDPTRSARILLIEDDPADQELTRRALREAEGLSIDLRIAADGGEALDYLFQRGDFADPERAPRPDLVLLDLNLPGTPGKRVLEAIKSDAKLRALPIVVLTTSARRRDIQESYELGCNSYVVKPLDAHQFFRVFGELCSYWLDVVALPES